MENNKVYAVIELTREIVENEKECKALYLFCNKKASLIQHAKKGDFYLSMKGQPKAKEGDYILRDKEGAVYFVPRADFLADFEKVAD